MSDLTDQVQDISDNLDQLSSDTQVSLDDHSQTLDELGQAQTDINDRTGQLDFPLTQDSIDRVKEIFPTSTTASMVAGTITVNDQQVQTSSKIIYSISIKGGTQGFMSLTQTNGQVIFTSTSNTDTSTINYVIFN
jgi:hypothetical protein